MTTLTNDQRQFIVAAARNQGTAQALLLKVRALGLNGLPAIVALLAAAASSIEASCKPDERAEVLNGMLADTLADWGGAAIFEPAAVAPAADGEAPLALLRLLRDMGMQEGPAISALLTAATALIEATYDPEHRALVLGAILAPKVRAWSEAAPVTVQ